MTEKLRPIDRENFDRQLQSFSIRAIVQNMNYLACKANEIIEAVNELLEREKEKKQSAEYEQFPLLSPCPICGSAAIMERIKNLGYSIGCTNYDGGCGVMPGTIFYKSAEKAIEAWNRRNNDEG